MKKLYIIIAAFLLPTVCMAQSKKTKLADKLFDRMEYVNAAKEYSVLVKNVKADGYVYKQLADCYYNIFNTKDASMWYGKAIETPQEAETYFKYFQVLKAEGKTAEAAVQMEKFASMKPNDSRAKLFKSNPNYIALIKRQNKLYNVKYSDVSSDNSDFGAVLTSTNELYFASARNKARKKSRVDGEPYLDLYKSTRNEDGTINLATQVTELNTKWHDGPATFSADGKSIIYASESFNESIYQKDNIKHLKTSQVFLFKADKGENDKWINSKPLPLNNNEYSLRNPSISNDGKTLYFSSNMPGGFGGEDIWKVSVNNDTYGTPENLGAAVNTEANESFPFIQNNNVLFFASNGKLGLGGYDVFKYNTTTLSEVTNIGEPVNSAKDDFALSYNLEKNVGYFSSNRDGNDDIYELNAICGVNAIVMVKDAETDTFLSESTITLYNSKGIEETKQVTNELGKTNFNVKCKEAVTFVATRLGYENGTASLEETSNDEKILIIKLVPTKAIITENEVILQPVYFEFDKFNITSLGAQELDKLVQVMNENLDMIIETKSHTDNRGSSNYNLKLSEKRAKVTVQYLLSKGIARERISGKGLGELQPLSNCKKCTEDEHSKNRRSEFLLIKK